VITTPAALAAGQHVMLVVHGCTGLTERQNNGTWSDE